MLATAAGVTAAVTLYSAYRNTKAWEAYHRADISRGQMVNKVFITMVLGAGTVALFLFRGLF
ncbi:MAG: hypothetical protein JWM80_437 [Cyanobacteria bacterium RYN_339]|nr:hypothetical protein [Cyanobacteria bacterium RYN_339]